MLCKCEEATQNLQGGARAYAHLFLQITNPDEYHPFLRYHESAIYIVWLDTYISHRSDGTPQLRSWSHDGHDVAYLAHAPVSITFTLSVCLWSWSCYHGSIGYLTRHNAWSLRPHSSFWYMPIHDYLLNLMHPHWLLKYVPFRHMHTMSLIHTDPRRSTLLALHHDYVNPQMKDQTRCK